ncbi:PREDICTED: putative carbonic anhydrase-like protein 2 [Priapulus caudatus]|uniref:Carbonic anhydrase-like protein 2 n=1 Tax=Priapulus caudatus TaxID=37621 RepID=A0ABM1EU84_PRICU|nr:PREDICTED: putative carbonic anhydrase-like protein 2 [Priapulus caudatus]
MTLKKKRAEKKSGPCLKDLLRFLPMTWRSRPDYWGLIVVPDWAMCEQGRRQSPINIDPAKLLYDPHLRPLHIDRLRLRGQLSNNGHNLVYKPSNDSSDVHLTISGGPLAYHYTFHAIHVHFGMKDALGSEHTVNDRAFPAEIQIIFYNSDLYANISEAKHLPLGVATISLLAQVGKVPNAELSVVLRNVSHLTYKGLDVGNLHLSICELLPDTKQYITYDGSLTTPGCYESVTWVIMNKPIYITSQQLNEMRALFQGTKLYPGAPLGNNYRPPQPIYHRPLRTNIDFNFKQSRTCPTMKYETYYQANVLSKR